MANRSRNHQLKIYLTEEERALFEQKMMLARQRNMSHFIRKCVLEKEIYVIDLEPFRKISGTLGNIAGNVNQIAKKTNQTGAVHKDALQGIRTQLEGISRDLMRIHGLLVKRTRG